MGLEVLVGVHPLQPATAAGRVRLTGRTAPAGTPNGHDAPDGAPDTVTANGISRRDVVALTRSGDTVLRGGDDDVTVAPDVSDLLTTLVDLGTGE
jgi:hypothetical protein